MLLIGKSRYLCAPMKSGWRYLYYALLLSVVASCVGNKQTVLLQDKTDGREFFVDTTIVSVQGEYILSVGDVLFFRIDRVEFGEGMTSLSDVADQNRMMQNQHPYFMGSAIDKDGFVEHAVLGRTMAAGKTIDSLRSELRQRLKGIEATSSLEVFLLDGTVSVLGEVARPGRYPIYKDRNTLIDLIGTSGGFQQYADRKTVKVIREDSSGVRTTHIDLTDLNALNTQEFHLQNNDIVLVAPLKRKQLATANVQWLVSSVTAIVAVASLVVSISSRP